MSTITLPKAEFINVINNVLNYIDMTKEASHAPTVDRSMVESAVYSLCEHGLMPVEKRASTVEALSSDPNKMCELLEKLAHRVGPNSLGGGDEHQTAGSDPESDFVSFCIT